jgi:hypothetical protein
MIFDNELLESLVKLSVDKKNQLIRYLSELFKSDLVLIKEIVIPDPPTNYTIYYKTPKYNKDGKLIPYIRYYLTGNLFYADAGSIHTVRKIVYESKERVFPYLKGLPELEKMRLEFEYHDLKDIDLDNKSSYWVKVFLDILKTPTARQLLRASKEKKPKPIITTNTINDDNTKCIDEIKLKFIKGEHKMIFRIYGRVKSEQKKMDLFFVN